MHKNSENILTSRLDIFCLIIATLMPVCFVIGRVAVEFVIGITSLLWLIRFIIAKDKTINVIIKHPFTIPWMLWFVSIAVSLLINDPGSKGWAHDLVYIRYFVFVIALIDISDRLPVHKYLLYGLAAGILWAAINMISAYVLGHDIIGRSASRYIGKMKEAARIAAISSYVAPFFCFWGFFDKELSKKNKSIIIGISLIAVVLVLCTWGRTIIIATTTAFCFCIIYFFYKKNAFFGIALIIISAIVLATCFFFHINKLEQLSSFYHRIYIWKVTIAMWLQDPIFGVGVSSFKNAFTEMSSSGIVLPYIAPDGTIFSHITYSHAYHAHNLLLMLLSCSGLFGFFSFSWLFINAVRLIFKNVTGFRIGLVSWPVIFFIIGLTGFNIFNSEYQALFAFFMALIGCQSDIVEKSQNETGQ